LRNEEEPRQVSLAAKSIEGIFFAVSDTGATLKWNYFG
jgi:hypothetical protein